VGELKDLAGMQIEYLALYGDIMNEIQDQLVKLENHRLHSITAFKAPYVTTHERHTIDIERRLDVPRWFGFYYYGHIEPQLAKISISPIRIDLMFMFSRNKRYASYVRYFHTAGDISMSDVIGLSGLPEDVWAVLLDKAKEIHQDVYKNLENLHDLAASIRDLVFSLKPPSNVSRDVRRRSNNLRSYKDEILNVVKTYEVLGNVECPCISEFMFHTVKRYVGYIEIIAFPYMKIEQIHSHLDLNKQVEMPKWLFHARDFRAYKTLIDVSLFESDIVLRLRYERADGNKDVENVLFVHGGKVSIDDLVLASYVLDDEAWKWILEEATNYLVLARETGAVLDDLVPAISLVS